MIGIEAVGIHVPETRVDNLDKLERHGVERDFVVEKIGVEAVSRKADGQRSSDLCVLAFEALEADVPDLRRSDVDLVCVCTQNGDFGLPHTAAVVHDKLGLPIACAAFDLGLGCSGWAYGVSLARHFMEANGLRRGLLFTSDPYSEIIDPDDRSTDLIFGDAAAVTLLSDHPRWEVGKGVWSTDGARHRMLIRERGGALSMDGRGVFGFVMKRVPESVAACLGANGLEPDDVDRYLLHQASRYVVENLAHRMGLDSERVPFTIARHGNTVSSTLPILLSACMDDASVDTVVASGYGVGLSVGTVVLKRCR